MIDVSLFRGPKRDTFSIFIMLFVATPSSGWKDERLDFSGDLGKDDRFARRGQVFRHVTQPPAAVRLPVSETRAVKRGAMHSNAQLHGLFSWRRN